MRQGISKFILNLLADILQYHATLLHLIPRDYTLTLRFSQSRKLPGILLGWHRLLVEQDTTSRRFSPMARWECGHSQTHFPQTVDVFVLNGSSTVWLWHRSSRPNCDWWFMAEVYADDDSSEILCGISIRNFSQSTPLGLRTPFSPVPNLAAVKSLLRFLLYAASGLWALTRRQTHSISATSLPLSLMSLILIKNW